MRIRAGLVVAAAGLVCCVGPWTLGSEGRFCVVGGAAEAVIVGSDDLVSCVENGYRATPAFLRTFIERSTGRTLRQVAEDDYDAGTMPFAIFLGNTRAAQARHGERLAALDRDAYVVEITPHAVYLVGARNHSTGSAMADFLETTMGIATYVPSTWGTIVPRHDRVVLEPSLRVERPAFTSRALSGLRTHLDGEKVNYFANAEIPWRIYRRDAFGHNLHTFVPVEEFGRTHPEYFPEIDGRRVIVSTSLGPGPCIANPDVVRIVTEKVLAHFADPRHADEDIISLGMTDGGWCECAACRATDGPDVNGDPSKSRRYYLFLNQVATALAGKHPGKSVGVLGYAGADWPPADLPIARNIVPYICQTRANWADPQVKAEQLRQTRAWLERVDRIGVYEYLYGSGFMVPRLYHGHLAEYLRTVSAERPAGFYAEIYSHHALDGPKAWVVEKLVWNPALDPAELQRLWCRRVFEEAAEPMDTYFAWLERCNTVNLASCPPGRKGRDSKFYMRQDDAQFNLFTPADVARAQELLADADRATTRPEIRERISYFRDGFEVAAISVQSYHAFREAQDLAAAEAPPADVLAALIRGEAGMPRSDPVVLMQEAVGRDASSFTPSGVVGASTATRLSMELVDRGPWSRVHGLIRAGTTDRDTLVNAATKSLMELAPAGWESDPLARRRLGMLSAMCRRVAVAPRLPADTAVPVVDGRAEDEAWAWQRDEPWWQWKSGIDHAPTAEFAFCHRGDVLYAAFRSRQDGLDAAKTVSGYGAPAWKVIGMELHLNLDERDDADPQRRHCLTVVGLGGGLYCNCPDFVKEWKFARSGDCWQAELALDLDAVGMAPRRAQALRMNMIHNTGPDGHYGKGWFPSWDAHRDWIARGWLVFGD